MCRVITELSVVTPVLMAHKNQTVFSLWGGLSFLTGHIIKSSHAHPKASTYPVRYNEINPHVSFLLVFMTPLLHVLEFWPSWTCNKRQLCNTLDRLQKKYSWKHIFRESAASYWEHNMLMHWAKSESKQEYFYMGRKNMLVMSKRQIYFGFLKICLVNHASGQLISFLWL